MSVVRTERKSVRPAFSLLEILVVLALFVLILTLLIPSFLQVRDSILVRQVSAQVEEDLRLIQSQVLLTGKSGGFQVVQGGTRYRTYINRGTEGRQILVDKSLPSSIRLRSSASGIDATVFQTDGSASKFSTISVISKDRVKVRIISYRTGRIRVEGVKE